LRVKEVSTLYVHEQKRRKLARPENKELKHFEKKSNITSRRRKTVTFQLTSRDFAYFNKIS
jgi:beta-glucosidase